MQFSEYLQRWNKYIYIDEIKSVLDLWIVGEVETDSIFNMLLSNLFYFLWQQPEY